VNDELRSLQRQYRNIEAPPHLATRIKASVDTASRPAMRWLPVSAAAMVIVATVWIVPNLVQQTTISKEPPSKPSLSALASLRPVKPERARPSLAQLRSVSAPAMPRRPKITTAEPQSRQQPNGEFMKEKDHAHS